METTMLNTKAALAEQTRMLNAKAKESALADMRKGKAAESPKTASKQGHSTTKPVIVAKTSEKVAKTARPKPLYIQYLTQLIDEGKYTRKELYDKTVAQFPEVAKSTVLTRITDGFNPKYTVFGYLLAKDADGRIHFAQ
ncbi:MAG: hypothetical protein JXB49_05930 [Bacteroidales bacterium]|nr:hypothetical protein [Bacteroidales bacterium]